MSAHSSSASLNEERLGLFREKHDAYKTLISHIAERLSPDDLRSLLWLTDAPPKLRNDSALDVLENLEMAGYFSERNVQKLLYLLKEIKRIDLMDKVNDYSLHYVRHYSLPGTIGPSPGHTQRAPRSFSVGSHLTGLTPFSYQETAGGPLLEQVHPSTPGGWQQYGMYSGGISDASPTTQKPSIPALSQDAALCSMFSTGPFATNYMSAGGDYGERQQSSMNESQSLSNSGSIHLNYNSHPSSRNASQEAFQLQQAPMPTNEAFVRPHFGGMQMPAEYYMPAFLSTPNVQRNWYQHTSLGSIPQDAPGQGPFTLRPVQPQHSRSCHNSAADVFPNSHSQEYQHHRFSQPQMYNYQYYTPPYSRRNPAMGGSNLRSSPSHSQPPIQEHALDDNLQTLSQQLPPGRSASEQPRRKNTEVATPASNGKVANSSASCVKQMQTKDNYANSEDRSCVQSENLKEVATLKERILNNTEGEAVTRRRTNSLQRESDHNGPPVMSRRRLSLVSMASCNTNGVMLRTTGSAGKLMDYTLKPGSKGSVMQSSSTLNSEDSRFSPTSMLTAKSRSSSANLRANRQKETFLSRLTQQFSRVVRPHKEIEWQIKRNKLSKVIYEHSDKFLTCPYKLELDGGLGASNPKLTLYVHPYGCEDDCNVSITLEVRIEISTRPKAQRLDSRAKVEVNVRAEDRESNVTVLGSRVVRESVRLNYFFIKGFMSHQELKLSHSDNIVIIISANLISVV